MENTKYLKNQISAVILAKNEEENIAQCIRSLSFCDEVLVIDDDSIDQTVDIAKRESAQIYAHKLNKNYAEQNNYAMEKAKYQWILFIDADERVSESLAREVVDSIENYGDKVAGFSLKRNDYFMGKWLKYGEQSRFNSLRLVKKGKGSWKRRVHQYFDVQGDVKSLDEPILHYPHKTLGKFIENINKWSTWHALANSEEKKKSALIKIILWPLGHFINNFIFKMGFLDGIHGFVYAMFMAFHSFLAWSKLYMHQKGFSKI